MEGHSQLLHAEGGREGEQERRLVLPGAFERSAADQRSRGILEGRSCSAVGPDPRASIRRTHRPDAVLRLAQHFHWTASLELRSVLLGNANLA
jgi:hypothetical protein